MKSCRSVSRNIRRRFISNMARANALKHWIQVVAILLLVGINLYMFTGRMSRRRTTRPLPAPVRNRIDGLRSESVVELLGDRIDVGRVIEGTKKQVQIRLKNISSGPVEVTSVQTTCTCFSKVGEVGGEFLPGEVKLIEMELEPRAGTSRWPVLIQTKNLQKYRFVAEGASYVDARVVPGRMELGEIPIKKTIVRQVTVEGDDTTQFTSGDAVTTSVDWIKASLERTTQSDEELIQQQRGPYSRLAVVHLEIMPTKPGKFAEVIFVKLHSTVTKTPRQVPIALTGRAVPEVVVRPESLRMDSTEPRLLKLRASSGPVKFKAFRSDIVEYVGTLPSTPVQSLELPVKLRGDRVSDRSELILDIEGHDPISIPVTVPVAKRQ